MASLKKDYDKDDTRLDLLVIGHGGRAEVRDPVRPEVILKMKKKGLNIEVLTTLNIETLDIKHLGADH